MIPPADDLPDRPDHEVSPLLRMGRRMRRAFFQTTRPLVQRHVEAAIMIRAGGYRPGGAYLELGCGLGYGAPIAIERFGADTFVGIDVDPEMIARARRDYGTKYGDRVSFQVANATELPFEDGAFKGVIQYAMFHHVRAWRTALTEAVRVLEPGGVLYFEEFLRGLILAPPIKAMFQHPYDSQFSSADLVAAMEDAGLELIRPPIIVGELAMAGAARKL